MSLLTINDIRAGKTPTFPTRQLFNITMIITPLKVLCGVGGSNMSETIEIFIQGEGIRDIKLVRVPHDGTILDIIEATRTSETTIPHDNAHIIVLIEDTEEELKHNSRLKDVGICHRKRLHLHRCHKIEVTINFNGEAKKLPFSSSTTIARVKQWADAKFELKGVDATEHILQICKTSIRPDEDIHVGALVKHPDCNLCFDLVPKKRVEG